MFIFDKYIKSYDKNMNKWGGEYVLIQKQFSLDFMKMEHYMWGDAAGLLPKSGTFCSQGTAEFNSKMA